MRVMILTDNEFIYNEFKFIVQKGQYEDITFEYFFSKTNEEFKVKYKDSEFKKIDLKDDLDLIIRRYKLILSLHCKQIFPNRLVSSIRCINIHPGFNPYNRGWFPQVFSILNKLPIGVTIHEMDNKLDHGPIILQREVKISSYDTSYDVYKKIQNLEIELLTNNLRDIIDRNYKSILPKSEGNINFKKNFDDLCEIDLDKVVRFRDAIDYLRALSFHGYENAYFYDEDGRKVSVEINLKVMEDKI
ncbi:dTDP-4-amino-4,6-dideoxyglucose formyltransferase [Clostridium intestinale]|uniref:dTDP-4-amino-4,6-dideoxyglucose formyltransferase n=1 Tax=Clostridium intestinale TaxID=36845 RepID=A0A7D7A1U8_9CLOT|nr:dTDP-4-amino-4,6-dideoxyglucose formyltransferase [Clostridium intestinale]QLY78758.1 dTDP-4-amino-4,6-dideoxyglucose formyltransferase [Clostridium intestinale]